MSAFRLPGFAAKPRVPAYIQVTKDGAELDIVELMDKALLLGRKVNHAPKQGTYRLDHDSVSREHVALVHSFDGTWHVTDLGSRYGTLLEGTPPLFRLWLLAMAVQCLGLTEPPRLSSRRHQARGQALRCAEGRGRTQDRRVHAQVHLSPQATPRRILCVVSRGVEISV